MIISLLKIYASAYQYKGTWPDFGNGLVLLIENNCQKQLNLLYTVHYTV